MTSIKRHQSWFLPNNLRAATNAMALVLVLTVFVTRSAQAQAYKVIYNFPGGQVGGYPRAGVTIDRAGNLYGTTNLGGTGNGTGIVFKLMRTGGGFIFSRLHSFGVGNPVDGEFPLAKVIIGPDGNLYGTTSFGGQNEGGSAYSLRPPPTACLSAMCDWNEPLLYLFNGSDEGQPVSPLVFDQAGNLYGTTTIGNTVYQLTRSGSGWTEKILYHLSGSPYAGVILDRAGNLYGTTLTGGAYNYGTVYQLTPSGSGWTENVLYSFTGGADGAKPYAGLIFDQAGNLYGGTSAGGASNAGTVFEVAPSGGSWTESVLYAFTGTSGGGPAATLGMDSAGSLYGTTYGDGLYEKGNVFKLTPSGSAWTYTSLYDFTGGSDGCGPVSDVVFDVNGHLYGTASGCGGDGYGVVWEITP